MSAFKSCLDCPDRYAGCHSKCEKYQQERNEYKEQKENEKYQKARDRV